MLEITRWHNPNTEEMYWLHYAPYTLHSFSLNWKVHLCILCFAGSQSTAVLINTPTILCHVREMPKALLRGSSAFTFSILALKELWFSCFLIHSIRIAFCSSHNTKKPDQVQLPLRNFSNTTRHNVYGYRTRGSAQCTCAAHFNLLKQRVLVKRPCFPTQDWLYAVCNQFSDVYLTKSWRTKSSNFTMTPNKKATILFSSGYPAIAWSVKMIMQTELPERHIKNTAFSYSFPGQVLLGSFVPWHAHSH